MVFAGGAFNPMTDTGRGLLTHELTHAAAGRAGPVAPTLRVSTPDEPEEVRAAGAEQPTPRPPTSHPPGPAPGPASGVVWRVWQSPTAGQCTRAEGLFLSKVVVDQEKAQQVTLHWNDGSVEAGMCSTGKGHCCTDSPDGTAGTVSESRRNGSNLTPITTGTGYVITDRYREKNGWKFWSTFVPARGIGLHQYPRVSGTPLSHGCVRMHEETAQKIFCGAVQGQTRVEVRGYARPDCAEPALRREWELDFMSAQVSDGEQPSADVLEVRRMLRESYGRELSADELEAGPDHGGNAIPRCSSRGGQPTVEEHRAIPVNSVATGVPTVASELLASSGLEALLPAFTRALNAAGSLARARVVARDHGQALWEAATGRRQRVSTGGDDRPLYWARLAMTPEHPPAEEPASRSRRLTSEALVSTLEDSSTGVFGTWIRFPAGGQNVSIQRLRPLPLGSTRRRTGGWRPRTPRRPLRWH